MDALTFFKDFVGPTATILAAAAAAFVTWSIQQQNAALKKDELRIHLFDRRYRIYDAAVEYTNYVLGVNRYASDEVGKSQQFGRIVLESRFTCSMRAQIALSSLRQSALDYLSSLDEINDAGEDEPTRRAAVLKHQIHRKALKDGLERLPESFIGDLKIGAL